METSVDTLVYQLEDDDTNVRWNTLQKLRRIAAVETSHFPVRNTRRFLQCIRRRIVGEAEPLVAIEALRLLGDVMISLGDNVDQILSSILPHLIPILPRKRNQDQDGDSDEDSDTLHEEIFQVFRKYTNATNDLQAVADLLVNIGLGNGHGAVREFSLIVLMRLLDERFLKRAMTRGEARNSIGRGDKALIVALVQAIIPALEDANEKVVVAAEEAVAKLESYWGSRFSNDVMKFLSREDKRTLQEHREPIADFLQACTASVSPVATPPQIEAQSSRSTSANTTSKDMREELRSDGSSAARSPSKVHTVDLTEELCFGFLKTSIVTVLTTNTSNSNADWKKRAAAVEKLYANCKEVDASTLGGLTAEERVKRMDELEGLFDILVRLTQDVDVHLVKRALQITQILFRKLSPPRHFDEDATQNESDEDDDPKDSPFNVERQKDAAFYMRKMLAPMVETSANFAGDDDDMESFVYALLGQVFDSGCVSVNSIEQVLASTSLRHRRSQVREEAVKVWIVLLLIAKRENLLPAKYAPNEYVVHTLGCLLGDTNDYVCALAFEVTAVLSTACGCNIYALLETFIDDAYVSERVDWAALRTRLRKKHIPELRANGTLRIKLFEPRSVYPSQSNRSAMTVEQSLDGFSELKMLKRPALMMMSTVVQPAAKETPQRSILVKSFLHYERKWTTYASLVQSEFDAPEAKAALLFPSLPEYNPADDGDAFQTQNADEGTYQMPKDMRVHPNKITVNVSAPGRQPTQHSPQHLQSLQSEASNYDDRTIKSMIINQQQQQQQGELENNEILSPSHDERPIRPMANSGDPDQIFLNFVDQDTFVELGSNETSSTRKNMSLATRKRLEAKIKQDGQLGTGSPTTIISQGENNQKPWKKPTNYNDEVDSTKVSKQEPRYLEVHEITPLVNPRQDLNKVLVQLRSSDWETNFDALNTVRRLAMHHTNLIDASMVHSIIAEIMKQVPNLRSSVSKNALLALESMCAAFSRAMDSEVENIVPVLLKRCGDSNTFVCESAAISLHAVVLKCSTSRVVSALSAHIRSKAVPIRREVARGIHSLIVGQVDGIQTSKDLSSILHLVGRCLEDSNNEVRDVAKQSVLHLHTKLHMSRERIKKFLPASAQTRVDNVLSGKVGYAHSNSSDISERFTASPAIKKRETPTAPHRTKKATKQSPGRTSPPTSSNATRSKIDADKLLRLETKLDSRNWKDRFDALNETTDFICSCASALVSSGHMLSLFDLLIKRLDDGNAKVNVLALECMDKIVPAIGSGMEQMLPSFVPAIAKNLANARTSSLAQSVVQQLCTYADNRALCQQFAIQARSANSRVIPMLLDTLTQLTMESYDDKSNYVLTRHVLPLALDLLKEAKNSVKEANLRLLRQLRITLGSTAISNVASKLSISQQDKLAAILR
ncbi:hypothetical protein PHMEG_000962 [Phytophthora megakarya]|uniref:TOG domain-containing protein n=1 Tax=Phytophthora megakarya TaxID=4795 RepID=A0A225X4B9_9STRA|nr:hypothetical protein PHMEG_000962 [Phytophthora megakarya]